MVIWRHYVNQEHYEKAKQTERERHLGHIIGKIARLGKRLDYLLDPQTKSKPLGQRPNPEKIRTHIDRLEEEARRLRVYVYAQERP